MPGMGFGFGFGFHRRASGSGAASAHDQLVTLATDDSWTALYGPGDADRTLRNDGSDDWLSALPDALGNWPDLEQGTAANQFKLLRSEFGGLDAMEGAADRYMDQASAINISQPALYVILFRSTAGGTANQTLIHTATGERNAVRITSAPRYDMAAPTAVGAGTPDTSQHVATAYFNGASSYFRIDGAQVFSQNPGTEGLAQLRVGAQPNLAAFFQGPIGVIVAFDGTPSDAVRDRMEDKVAELAA